jgi:hypothetical protein
MFERAATPLTALSITKEKKMRPETHKPPMSVIEDQQERAEDEITDDTFVSGINGRLESLPDLSAIKEGLEEIGDLNELNELLPSPENLEHIAERLEEIGDLNELNELLPSPENLELIAERLDELGDLEGLSKVLPSSEEIERVSDQLSTLGDLDDLESKIDRISEKLKGVLEMKEQVEASV